MAMSEQERAVQSIKDPAARKKAYYRLQREHAEESGDQKTTDKVYAKLGKKSHNVDSSRVDKGILGLVGGAVGAGEGAEAVAAARGARGASKLIPEAAERLGSAAKSLGSKAKGMLGRRTKTTAANLGTKGSAKALVSSASRTTKNVTPKQKALPPASGKTSGISQADAKRMRAVERAHGAIQPTPKNKGTGKVVKKASKGAKRTANLGRRKKSTSAEKE